MQTGIEMMPFCFKASYSFGITAAANTSIAFFAAAFVLSAVEALFSTYIACSASSKPCLRLYIACSLLARVRMVGAVPMCPPERPRSGVSMPKTHALCAGNERWMRPCGARGPAHRHGHYHVYRTASKRRNHFSNKTKWAHMRRRYPCRCKHVG